MSHTVHLDRNGYVVEVFLNTKPASLDAQKYAGTLMEVLGDVCPGWRWDGQRFVLPPPRIPVEAVAVERDRRINTHFPERLREQVTAFGRRNAVRMQRYIAEVQQTAEAMMLGDPPQDFKDDRRWPAPPIMEDMDVPVRVHDVPTVSAAPVTINVAPVINATAPEARPLEAQVSQAKRIAPPVELDEYGLDTSDPLYPDKVRLVQAIDAIETELGESADERWKESVARLAAYATASVTREDFDIRAQRVGEFIERAA